MIKLGEKLGSVCTNSRLILLSEGKVFYTKDLEEIKFNGYCLYIDDHQVGSSTEHLLDKNWYYPAPTYTINGVELVDERVKEIDEDYKEYYVCDCIRSDYFNYSNSFGTPTTYLQKVIERSLLHKTKEAAVLHTKAMMKVSA